MLCTIVARVKVNYLLAKQTRAHQTQVIRNVIISACSCRMQCALQRETDVSYVRIPTLSQMQEKSSFTT
jgi:hypothetical protein